MGAVGSVQHEDSSVQIFLFFKCLEVQMSTTFQIIETIIIFQLHGGKMPVKDAYFSMYLLNGWNEKRSNQ